jgi:hypothetical protein
MRYGNAFAPSAKEREYADDNGFESVGCCAADESLEEFIKREQ